MFVFHISILCFSFFFHFMCVYACLLIKKNQKKNNLFSINKMLKLCLNQFYRNHQQNWKKNKIQSHLKLDSNALPFASLRHLQTQFRPIACCISLCALISSSVICCVQFNNISLNKSSNFLSKLANLCVGFCDFFIVFAFN